MLLEALRGLTAFACLAKKFGLYIQVTGVKLRLLLLGKDRGARLEMVWRQVQWNNLRLQLMPLGWRGVEG